MILNKTAFLVVFTLKIFKYSVQWHRIFILCDSTAVIKIELNVKCSFWTMLQDNSTNA